jgi:hypothetical protein
MRSGCIAPPFLTTALERDQLHAPTAVTPGNTRQYQLYWRLGGPQSKSGRYRGKKYFLLFTLFWRGALLEKLPIVQLLKNFPAFYGTRTFKEWSLSSARSIQSIPFRPISLKSILIFSTHLRLGLPNGHFPTGFPTNIVYAYLLSPIRATCPAHFIIKL